MSFFGSSKSKSPPPPSQFQQTPPPMQVPQDVVPGEQYRYALTNFRIAHEKVEEQRAQLEEQERQVAQLRARIAQLEGSSAPPDRAGQGGNTVDDFSIKNAASQLEKMINRWASDVVRVPPMPLAALCQAILTDVGNGPDVPRYEATSMQVQALLRHAISEAISEGIVNCLIVTNSSEANDQLTRIHEHIFARDPTVACVWRRQTFSAAVEIFSPEMSLTTLHEQVPELMRALNNAIPTSGKTQILESAYAFSRMLHGQNSTAGDAFYRAFVPELGSALNPRQVELIKRCLKSERGEPDRVGATIFPGLVKVTKAPSVPGSQPTDSVQNVVRRAQVICECALFSGGTPGSSLPGTPAPVLHPQGQLMNGYGNPLPNQHMNGYQSPPPDGAYMNGYH